MEDDGKIIKLAPRSTDIIYLENIVWRHGGDVPPLTEEVTRISTEIELLRSVPPLSKEVEVLKREIELLRKDTIRNTDQLETRNKNAFSALVGVLMLFVGILINTGLFTKEPLLTPTPENSIKRTTTEEIEVVPNMEVKKDKR